MESRANRSRNDSCLENVLLSIFNLILAIESVVEKVEILSSIFSSWSNVNNKIKKLRNRHFTTQIKSW